MSAWLVRGEQIPIESSLEENAEDQPPAVNELMREIAMRETEESLFPRLKEFAKEKPALLKAIRAWEESRPLADRIPKCDLSDKQTHALRTKAREFLRESAAKDGVVEPTGKEPLML